MYPFNPRITVTQGKLIIALIWLIALFPAFPMLGVMKTFKRDDDTEVIFKRMFDNGSTLNLLSDKPRNKAYAKKEIPTTSILTDFHPPFAIISFNSLHWQKGMKSIVHLRDSAILRPSSPKRQCSVCRHFAQPSTRSDSIAHAA